MKHEEEEEEDKGSVGKGERIKSGEEEEGGEGVGGKWGERSDVSEAPQGQMTRPTPSRTGYLRVPAASLSFLPICRITSAYLARVPFHCVHGHPSLLLCPQVYSLILCVQCFSNLAFVEPLQGGGAGRIR